MCYNEYAIYEGIIMIGLVKMLQEPTDSLICLNDERILSNQTHYSAVGSTKAPKRLTKIDSSAHKNFDRKRNVSG